MCAKKKKIAGVWGLLQSNLIVIKNNHLNYLFIKEVILPARIPAARLFLVGQHKEQKYVEIRFHPF